MTTTTTTTRVTTTTMTTKTTTRGTTGVRPEPAAAEEPAAGGASAGAGARFRGAEGACGDDKALEGARASSESSARRWQGEGGRVARHTLDAVAEGYLAWHLFLGRPTLAADRPHRQPLPADQEEAAPEAEETLEERRAAIAGVASGSRLPAAGGGAGGSRLESRTRDDGAGKPLLTNAAFGDANHHHHRRLGERSRSPRSRQQAAAAAGACGGGGGRLAAAGGGGGGPPLRGAEGARALRNEALEEALEEEVSPRWQSGRDGAREVLAQSLEQFPRDLEAAWPRAGAWLEIELEVALQRALEIARREWRVGGRAYIGSTSDPAWRWNGGWYLPSEGGSERRRRAVQGEWAWMDGHRLRWRRMAVLGSWRDVNTGYVEEQAIKFVSAAEPGSLTNKCEDARGLARRPWGYSFVYICFDQRMPHITRKRH